MMLLFLLFVLLIVVLSALAGRSRLPPAAVRAIDPRKQLDQFIARGEHQNMLTYLEDLEKTHGSLVLDNISPSLYMYKGVALYSLHLYEEAAEVFQEAVALYPQETRSWINLGESQMLSLNFKDALESFTSAFRLEPSSVISRLMGAKAWCSSWKDIEYYVSIIEKMANVCYKNLKECRLETAVGLEMARGSGEIEKILHGLSPLVNAERDQISPTEFPKKWLPGPNINPDGSLRKLKVAFLSSDFDVHPVSSLIRGVIQFMDKSKFEVYCFSIAPKVSWWGLNISREAYGFAFLHSMNTYDAAKLIASHKIEILIDLNGHTKGSGLPYMAHKPAPIQLSYLGLPTSTSSKYIDYYIGDYVALPPEHRSHFSERLGLMRPCYIANDYAQTQGDIVRRFSGKNRAPRSSLNADIDVTSATLLFGTISNSQKMDPLIFHVWMNILGRFSGSKLVFHDHKGMAQGLENLRSYSAVYGVDPSRLGLAELAPWIDHLYRKTSIDMMLDTAVKNGHTTGLDGIWAGVPTVALGGGATMPARAAESIANGLGSELGLTYSLKEYEDLVLRVCQKNSNSGRRSLNTIRKFVEDIRSKSYLFDTPSFSHNFSRQLESIWEVSQLHPSKKYHIFAQVKDPTFRQSDIALNQLYDERSKVFPGKFPDSDIYDEEMKKHGSLHSDTFWGNDIPDDMKAAKYLFLNIGGIHKADGWFNVNPSENPYSAELKVHSDIIRDMWNLSGIPDNSVAAIYSAHTYERSAFFSQQYMQTLLEWNRVMLPGGILQVSVPDLKTIAQLFRKTKDVSEKMFLMKILFGSQLSKFDFKLNGYTESILVSFLQSAGFCEIDRMRSFNMFSSDPSDVEIGGMKISLNLVAKKCVTAKNKKFSNGFEISHNGTPYYTKEEPQVSKTSKSRTSSKKGKY